MSELYQIFVHVRGSVLLCGVAIMVYTTGLVHDVMYLTTG